MLYLGAKVVGLVGLVTAKEGVFWLVWSVGSPFERDGGEDGGVMFMSDISLERYRKLRFSFARFMMKYLTLNNKLHDSTLLEYWGVFDMMYRD